MAVTRVFVASFCVVVSACSSLAQDGMPFRIKPELRIGDQIGEASFSGGDIDLDGLPDILSCETRDFEAFFDVIVWHGFSGRTGEHIFTLPPVDSGLRSMQTNGIFVGDVDDDRYDDFALAYHDSDAASFGFVHVHSGRTGKILFELGSDSGFDVLGRDLAAVGDLDGDLIPDLGIITRAQRDGHVSVVSCVDGRTIWRTEVPWPRRIERLGDVNDDQIDDVVVGLWRREEARGFGVVVLSGRDGSLIYTVAPLSADFGWDVAGGEDLTGDGKPDFAVMQWYSDVFVFDGASGELFARFDASVTGLDLSDVDGDGAAEIYVHSTNGGEATRLDGPGDPAPVRVIRRYQPAMRAGSGIWANSVAIADFNDDGFSDVAVGVLEEIHVFSGGELGLLAYDYYRIEFQVFQHPDDLSLYAVGAPGETVHILQSIAGKDCTFVPQYGVCIDLTEPIRLIGNGVLEEDGELLFEWDIPVRARNRTMWFQAVAVRGDHLARSNVLEAEIR